MEKKVALIILFNHRYDKNIEILERIYKDRFSNIFHIIPFYDGEKDNVISVYENSYNFEGYIAQAYKYIFKDDFVHYFFIADDMILNPIINERNYTDFFKLKETSCFFPDFVEFHKLPEFHSWNRAYEAYSYQIKCAGVENQNEIPTYEDAIIKFAHFGFEIKPLNFNQIFPKRMFFNGFNNIKKIPGFIKWYAKSRINKEHHLSYPLVGGYSDIIIISGDIMKRFSHYCGVFAATNLFVEIAIPTAIVLSATEIITEKDLALKGKALWTEKELKELERFDNKLKNILNDFPKEYIYLHPVKLSKLNIDL